LLAINPQLHPYRVLVPGFCLPPGSEFVSTVHICVNELGSVVSVQLLKSSTLALVDRQLPDVISLWRFHPYLVDGRPAPFCYNMNYRVR
jgi:TonB family protein